MRTRLLTSAALCAATILSGTALAQPAQAVTVPAPTRTPDFNNDGYPDLAVRASGRSAAASSATEWPAG